MKFTLLFLLLSFLIYGCKNKELPAKYLSTITVVRETGGNHNIRQTGEEATSPSHATPILPQQANTHSGTRYHIIVGSFSSAEKKRAEQLVEKLKAQDYPATLISSSQRYRVSIESFPTENGVSKWEISLLLGMNTGKSPTGKIFGFTKSTDL